MRITQENRVWAQEHLREMLRPGDTVYTILRHVSRSGMSRRISCVVVVDDEARDITGAVGLATGYRISTKHEGLIVNGAGMDMGFAVVYDLGRTLYPEGFDTPAGYVRNEPMTHDPDGGYALRHRWL